MRPCVVWPYLGKAGGEAGEESDKSGHDGITRTGGNSLHLAGVRFRSGL